MAHTRQSVLALALTGVLLQTAAGRLPQRFFPDDPIEVMPAPMSVGAIARTNNDEIFDFFEQSKTTKVYFPPPAGGINTLGEVPDSEWFTNRHARQPMSRDELQSGGYYDEGPAPPFEVIGGKSDGIMPGFRMKDAKGRKYFVKGDPIDYPEIATAAENIVSRFLYAVGYNTPKNKIAVIKVSDLSVSPSAKINLPGDKTRHMVWSDLQDFLRKVHRNPDGSVRVIASLAVEGENVGPFQYQGTRPDDPNDLVPHQNRRDLRGLFVVSAWLNNTDVKAGNTMDSVVEENGRRFIRHYQIDFGSALGSDGDRPKDARFGNEYALPTVPGAIKSILQLGLIPKDWERVDFPKLPGVGRFEADSFEPNEWKSDFPNRAFLSRLPDDDFWGAKQVMAFTDDDIRAVVETGQLSAPISVDYIVSVLCERRNKIGQTFFSKILPLDRFRVENGELLFDDLAVRYGFQPPRHYSVRWSRFDNADRKHEPIADAISARLPAEALNAAPGTYFSASISVLGNRLKPVSVYVRKENSGYKVVGIDRSW